MAISPTTSTTDASSTAALTSNATDAQATSDRFLKLLVAQMQNQDPLSPMDNAEVTSQMAQINTVSGIQQLNTTMQSLTGQFTQLQALQGVSLVGHDVVVPGNGLQISNSVGTGGYELTSPADSVKVDILSSSGSVVDSINMGAQAAGLQSFTWPAGTATSGLTFRVTATSGGTASAATTMVLDHVDAVTTSGGVFSLELTNSGTVPYSVVKAFN